MSSYQYWTEIAGVWGTIYFAAIFAVAVGYAMWPSKEDDFNKAAQAPLIED